MGEACGGGVAPALGHDISGKGDHRNVRVVISSLPLPNLTAGFVAVFYRHLDVALKAQRNEKRVRLRRRANTYYYYRIVRRFVGKYKICALFAVPSLTDF